MITLPWPALTKAPATFEWWLLSSSLNFTSPLDGSVQTLELPGARWMVSIVMTPLQEYDTALMESFLAKLRGQANRFTLWNMSRPAPRGTISGSPLVNGAQAAGASLNIKSAPVGSTLLEGDYIGLNGELRLVGTNATADGGGLMTLALDSPLRNAVTDGMAITLLKPLATFMMTSPEMPHAPKVPGSLGLKSYFTLQAQEVW